MTLPLADTQLAFYMHERPHRHKTTSERIKTVKQIDSIEDEESEDDANSISSFTSTTNDSSRLARGLNIERRLVL